MLDINLIQSTSSWPFVEVRKLLKDRKELIKKKNKINFQKLKEFKEYVSIEHEKSSRNQASNSIPKSLNTIKINCA